MKFSLITPVRLPNASKIRKKIIFTQSNALENVTLLERVYEQNSLSNLGKDCENIFAKFRLESS